MRASCSASSEEIDVHLSKGEVKSLEHEILTCSISLFDGENHHKKPFSVRLGRTPSEYIAYLQHDPKNSNYLESKSIQAIISRQAYSDLQRKGMT